MSYTETSASTAEQFRLLYDPDRQLMEGNSVDGMTVDQAQFVQASTRAYDIFVAALKTSGHALSEKGVMKFLEYLSHHRIGNVFLDTRREEVLRIAFNKFSQIGGFGPADFVNAEPAARRKVSGKVYMVGPNF